MRRIITRIICLPILTTLTAVATAGYYAVTYTFSGTFHAWNAYTNIYSSPSLNGGVVSGGVGISGNAHATGASSITPHFTWVPDNPSDLPPKVAILKEEATSSGSCYPTGGTATANDGIGHQASNNNGSASAGGVRYTVVPNPGQSWSPVSAVTPSQSANKNGGQAGVAMSYKGGLYAVWIDTDWTVNADTAVFAEAGRPMRAYLTCWLPGVHFDTHAWGATGSLVKGYSPSETNPDVPTHPVQMSEPDWHVASPAWYYFKASPSVISCSARIFTDDGLLNATIETYKDIGVEKVVTGGSAFFSNQTNVGFNGTYYLYTDTNPGVTYEGTVVGMTFSLIKGLCGTALHFPPGGSVSDVQLINALWMRSGLAVVDTHGEYYLDNSFPYRNTGLFGQAVPGGNFGVNLSDFDSPAFGGFQASVATVFDMNVIYKPGIEGSIWIPSSYIGWTWTASGVTSGQPSGNTSLISTDLFPEWDHRQLNMGI